VPLKLIIRFTSSDAAAGHLVHRIRNFAEELERALTRESAGHVDNMDTAVTSVEVTIDSRRKLGRALALAKKTLDRHNLSDGAVLER
jgi:hypothetical protein